MELLKVKVEVEELSHAQILTHLFVFYLSKLFYLKPCLKNKHFVARTLKDNPINLNVLEIAFPYRGRFLSGSLDSSRYFAVSLRGKYTHVI